MTTDHPIANQEAFETWNGPTGQRWAASAERLDRLMHRVTPHLMEAASIEPASRVLDVGCGCGETSRLAARRATRGGVVGIDMSSVMLDRAREGVEEERLGNLRLLLGDAQTHPFEQASFDVAMSRLGLMSFDDPDRAFENIGRALRPGGLLAFVSWGDPHRNQIFTVPAAAFEVSRDGAPQAGPGPFALADPDYVHALLERTGWSEISVGSVEEPLWLGETLDDAIAMVAGFAEGMLGTMTPEGRERGLARLRADLAGRHDRQHGITLGSSMVLATARRRPVAGDAATA